MWSGTNFIAGGEGDYPLAYSPDGTNWTSNSLVTDETNKLVKTYVGKSEYIYYAYATCMNSAGTRLAVLSSGSGVRGDDDGIIWADIGWGIRFKIGVRVPVIKDRDINVCLYIYDYDSNIKQWNSEPSYTANGLGTVKYMGQMKNWFESTTTSNLTGFATEASPYYNNVNGTPSKDGCVNLGCTPIAFNGAGNILAVGVNGQQANITFGYVNIYNYSNNTWNLIETYRPHHNRTFGWTFSTSENYFGSSVAFNALGNRLFVSSIFNSDITIPVLGGITSGFVNVYDYSIKDNGWLDSPTFTLSDGNVPKTAYGITNTPGYTFYGASIATNGIGNVLVVGAPSCFLRGYYGFVYIYQTDFSGNWSNTPTRYYCGDPASGNPTFYENTNFGNSVSINSIGDRIAIGELNQIGSNQYQTTESGTGNAYEILNSAGRIYIIDYNYAINQWPGTNGSFGKDVATIWALAGSVSSVTINTVTTTEPAWKQILISIAISLACAVGSAALGAALSAAASAVMTATTRKVTETVSEAVSSTLVIDAVTRVPSSSVDVILPAPPKASVPKNNLNGVNISRTVTVKRPPATLPPGAVRNVAAR